MHFAGTGSKAGTILIKVNKSFIKLLIMHFAGTGSKAGTMLIKVNKCVKGTQCNFRGKNEH